MAEAPITSAVVTCMRNEGPFVLEWVAYHRAIGFDDIVVVTNDCTDGTDAILDQLAAQNYVSHIRNENVGDDGPQVSGMRLAMALDVVSKKDWVLHCDADEFFCLTGDADDIDGFLSGFDDADAIALLWKCFGDNGIKFWRGGNVLRSFTKTDPKPFRRNIFHKSLFRPARFAAAIDHMPKSPRSNDVRVVVSDGREIPNRPLFHPNKARFNLGYHECTWTEACINHYAIRSQDVFLMKNRRGDGMGWTNEKYMLGSTFHSRNNRNIVEDRLIQSKLDRCEAVLSEFLENPETRRLDKAALDHFCANRDAILTPAQIKEWTVSATE